MLSMLSFIEHRGHGRYRTDKTDINSPCSSRVKWRETRAKKGIRPKRGGGNQIITTVLMCMVQKLQNANNKTRQSKKKNEKQLVIAFFIVPESLWLALKRLMKQLLNSTLAELWQQAKWSLICKKDKRKGIKTICVITDSTPFSFGTSGIEYDAYFFYYYYFFRVLKYCCWKMEDGE